MTDKLTEAARGVYPISATPFTDDGALDFESTDRLIDFYLETGVHGLTILGMMGEAPKLTPEESEAFVAHVAKRLDGRIPLIVGVSSPGLAMLDRLAKASMDLGAAGVMVAPPPSVKTEVQLFGYFDQVFAALGDGVPVCFQDYPTATGVHVSVASFLEMVRRYPTLVMLKHEDFPALRKLSQIRDAEAAGEVRRVSILVANAGLYYPLEMRRGADGVMTGFAYPEMLVQVYDLFQQGDPEAAEDLYDAYLPLLRYEYQPGVGLAVRKEIFKRRGIIRSAHTRAPGPALDRREREELDTLIQRLERRLAG